MLRIQADACLLNLDKTGENEEVCERENGRPFETRLSTHCIYDILHLAGGQGLLFFCFIIIIFLFRRHRSSQWGNISASFIF